MLSTYTTHLKLVPARGRFAVALVALMALLAAGCGGGGGKSGDTKEKGSTTKTTGGKPGAKPGGKAPRAKTPTGGVIKAFSVKVIGPGKGQIKVTLTKPEPLAVQVRKITTGNQSTKVGRQDLGTKPKGASTIAWNLAVKGKKLAPGKYRVVLRAGKTAGKSKPALITVPG